MAAASPCPSVGQRLRETRRRRNWSQTELAFKAGVSRPTIARIEAGHRVQMSTLLQVAAVLDLQVTVVQQAEQ